MVGSQLVILFGKVMEALGVAQMEEVSQWRHGFEGYPWSPDTSSLSPFCPSRLEEAPLHMIQTTVVPPPPPPAQAHGVKKIMD